MTRLTLAFLLSSFLCLGSAVAQTPAEQALREQEKIIQRQQQDLKRLQEGTLEERLRRKSSDLSVEQGEDSFKEAEDALCFDIETIIITGNTVVSDKRLDKVKQPYLGTCMSLGAINKLIRAIDNLYITKGYVTSKSYVPDQNLKQGTLTIDILEGKIESIELNDNSTADKLQIATAFPNLKGKLLNVRDIEQGIDQMNRLPSNNTKVEFAPGSKVGYSVVKVTNVPKGKRRASFGIDNHGQKATGVERGTLGLGYDNLFKLNDTLSFNYIEDLGNNDNERLSRSYLASASIPYGKWLFSSSFSLAKSLSMPLISGVPLRSAGKTSIYKGGVSRLMYRNKNAKTTFSTNLALKDTEAFQGGALSAAGTRKLTVFDAGIDQMLIWKGSIINANVKYSQGLKALGARKDPSGLNKTAPKAQFEKFSTDISLYRPFKIKKLPLAYLGSFSAQYSSKALFGSERISAGDQYSVRGFKEEALQGDSGMYIRNEISYNLPKWSDNKYIEKTLGKLQLFALADAGKIRAVGGKEANFGEGEGYISGYGFGLKNNSSLFNFDITYSQPIKAPAFIEKNDHEVYASASVKVRW